jgi:predicted lipoprotein with Yx(FWY)xxD motif
MRHPNRPLRRGSRTLPRHPRTPAGLYRRATARRTPTQARPIGPARSALAAAGALLSLAGCSLTPVKAAPVYNGPDYRIGVATVPALGTILVDGRGHTLYMFVPDKQGASTCYGTCAIAWPPLDLPPGVSAPQAAPGVNPALLGVVRRTDGGREVTYNHWPLYFWIGDNAPGLTRGDGKNSLGGLWWVLNAKGIPVTS